MLKFASETLVETYLIWFPAVVTSINNQISSKSEGRLFAVVHIQGKQFKVTPEDIIIVQDKFMPTIGDQIRLNKV